MTEEGKRRWTLILMREGQVNSRTLAMSRGKVLAFGGLALVALATAFFATGKWVGDLASRGHVEALEAEVLDLQEENAEQGSGAFSSLSSAKGSELIKTRLHSRTVQRSFISFSNQAALAARSVDRTPSRKI
mgnify:CR=1 FL=1